jgi:ferredoxin
MVLAGNSSVSLPLQDLAGGGPSGAATGPEENRCSKTMNDRARTMTNVKQDSWSVEVAGGDKVFHCSEDQSLLNAMISAGRCGIKVGCRNGGCGICRVRITDGRYSSKKMTRSRISEGDEAEGIVLACRVFPSSDISLEPLPLRAKGWMK